MRPKFLKIPKLPKFIEEPVRRLLNNSPALLTGTTVVGTWVTAGISAKDTLIFQENMEELREKYPDGDIPKKELALVIAKSYWPTGLSALLTSGAAIGSYKASARDKAVLAGLYSASESMLSKYRDSAVEVVGEKEAEKIQKHAESDYIATKGYEKKDVIVTGNGEVRFMEPFAGKRFTASVGFLERVKQRLKDMVRDELWITANDFLYELNLSMMPTGGLVGWNVEHGHQFDFRIEYVTDWDGQPVGVILVTPVCDHEGRIVADPASDVFTMYFGADQWR